MWIHSLGTQRTEPGIVLSTGVIVQYTTWLNDFLVAVVKERNIVHIDLNGRIACDVALSPTMHGFMVIDYQVNDATNLRCEWSLVTAIKQEVSRT